MARPAYGSYEFLKRHRTQLSKGGIFSFWAPPPQFPLEHLARGRIFAAFRMTLVDRRVLYISYNGMLDPLGQSQVIPYLKELSKAGVRFTLLSFERERAYTPEGVAQCRELQRKLAQHKIDWHWLRYHKRPSLPATMFDVAQGIRLGYRLVKQNNIEMVHARSHIAARIALALKRRFSLKFIFDVRGLMADEYVDAGHWQK